jgi:hypothetical protein
MAAIAIECQGCKHLVAASDEVGLSFRICPHCGACFMHRQDGAGQRNTWTAWDEPIVRVAAETLDRMRLQSAGGAMTEGLPGDQCGRKQD